MHDRRAVLEGAGDEGVDARAARARGGELLRLRRRAERDTMLEVRRAFISHETRARVGIRDAVQ